MNAETRLRTRLIGLITGAIATVLVVVVFSGQVNTLFGESLERTVTARFEAVGTLNPGSEVRIQGAKVGKVETVELAPDHRSTIVKMKVGKDTGPLYRDARAKVRWRTLLGGAFYVGLERGSARTGDLGEAEIPKRNTTAQVELEDVTSVVRGPAKRGLKQLPGELARALDDPSVAANTLDTAQSVSPEVKRVGRALRGVHADRDLRRLVAGTARTVQVLGRRTTEVRRLVEGAAATLRVTAGHAEDIRSMLALAPTVMRTTNATLADLRHTLDVADPVVTGLNAAAPKVAPTLADLHPTVVDADVLLRRARPLLRDLRPTITSLAGFADRGLPVLDALTPTLDRLGQTVLPDIARKWPETGISTTVAIGAGLSGLAGIAGPKDANGHVVRFPLTVGSGTAYLPCQAFPNNPDLAPQQQLGCQSLKTTLDHVLSWKPLPAADGPSATTRAKKRGG